MRHLNSCYARCRNRCSSLLGECRHVSDLFLDPRNRSHPDFLLTAKFPFSWRTSPHISWKVQCICSETLPYPCWCFLYLQLLLLFYLFLLFINIFKSLLFKKKSMYLYLDSTTSLTVFQNLTSLLIFHYFPWGPKWIVT